MLRVQSVVDFVEKLAGHRLNLDEGVHHGAPTDEVSRITVCWMATLDALEYAGAQGGGLVLAHESLYYPYGALPMNGKREPWQDWPTNARRLALLERHAMPLLRVHGSADEICIFDDFAALLGLGAPVAADGLAKVYELDPRPLRDLVEIVKQRMGMPAVRVSAPRGLGQPVRRIGLPWGGLGLFVNVSYQQRLIEMGCDALIAGESDNYGARFAADLGIPLIETDHEVSENPGLRRFAGMLQDHFPDTPVDFYECPRVWRTL